MKNLFKMTLILVAAALTLTGCDCFKKMAKKTSNLTITCTPDVLTLSNGKVVVDVTAEIPAKFFHKRASMKVTPALVYEGGVTKGKTFVLQGEKVAKNGILVKKGKKFVVKRHLEFKYKPEMQLCDLVLLVEGHCSRKECKSQANSLANAILEANNKCHGFILINANTGKYNPMNLDLAGAEGMTIDGGEKCLPAEFLPDMDKPLECRLILHEGKFHQVKRMFQALDNKVVYLKRIAIGNLPLDESLELGKCLEILHKDVEKLLTP